VSIVSVLPASQTVAPRTYPSRVAGIPAEAYHKLPEWSQSQLKPLPDHPELFAGYHIRHEWEIKQTDDMWLGECLHAVHLEGKPIVEIPEYALTSNGQRRGNTWRDWEAAHEGDFYLLPKDAQRIKVMSDGLMADPKCRAILEAPGECEHSYFFTDPETGILCRARIDKLACFGQARVIGDIKATCIDVSDARQVGQKVLEMQYHRQGPWYLDAVEAVDGVAPDGFAFLFVRNKPPYNAACWVLGSEEIALGRRRNQAARLDLHRRLKTGDWTGLTHGKENLIVLPRYAYSGDVRESDGSAWDEFNQFNGENHA
jgi:exodeoxyribonuclease VIII